LPNIKSAEKRVAVAARKAKSNKMAKSALKTAIKKSRLASEFGSGEEPVAAFIDAQKAIDKAAARGILHKNTAARRKSRLAAKLPKE
jgi:small subunit ribosomal protein S20